MDSVVQNVQPRRCLEFENDKDHIDSSIDDESEKSCHAKIAKTMIPEVGMEFETENAAYEFYNSYAKEVGFSVRKSKAHSNMGKVLDRKFVCSCEGKRGQDKRDNVYKSHRAETRFGCLAMMKIDCRNTSKYKVVIFVAEHNHNLATPSKVHLFRSHRKVSLSQAADIEMADKSGIAPRKAFEFMAKQAGGRENLGFARVDYNNYLRSKRIVPIGPGVTRSLLGYLQMMQLEDPNFFYAIQVDEDDLITNIFWADAKMMSDYDDFGDVVCFDTTYRKHKDGRPIGLFVGVNHHKKTIIFGIALLYDETTDSFIWLFDTFVKAMGGKLPKTVITDQDAAMSKALAYQWPSTYHRLCIWHIFQNAATHLSSVFEKFKDFAADFSSCVYDHDNEEEFLNAWSEMLQKYNLNGNEWLMRLFDIKEKWALVYGRDTFCADMITTQRSESMNNVIKHYVSSKHDLPRFFEHFQQLLDERRYDELVADFKANHSNVSLSLPVEILKHAAVVYTQEVFVLFQAEVCKAFDCVFEISCAGEGGEAVKYVVKHVRKHSSFVVSYDAREEIISCSCRKFEFVGILCSHILRIFSARGIITIPEKYILKRWTKDARKGSVTVNNESSTDLDPRVAMARRYRDLCRLSTHFFTRAAESEETYNIVKERLINLRREVDSNSVGKPVQSSLSLENCHVLGSDPSQNVPICNNDKMKTNCEFKLKPKPRSKSSQRIKSALKKANRSKRGKKQTLPNDSALGTSNQVELVTTQNSRINVPTQETSMLALLHHSQCDDFQAYARLLQGEM